MIETVKLEAHHLMKLLEAGVSEYMVKPHVTIETAKNLESQNYAFTCISKESGRILMCGGIAEYWENRGEAWALLSTDCRAEFIGLHNATKRLFEVCPIRRIEAAVDVDFHPGHRWIMSLGFKLEAPRLKSYTVDGRDVSLYARVK